MASIKLYGPTTGSQTGGAVAINTFGATKLGPLPAKQVFAAGNAAATVILNPLSPTLPLVVQIPPNSPLEQKRFRLRASGYFTAGQSTNVTFELRTGSSATAGSDAALATTSTQASGGANTRPWAIEAELIYDSVSGYLDGWYTFIYNGVTTTVTKITGAPISLTINNAGGVGGAAVLSFVIVVTIATATNASTVNVQDFAIEF